MEQKEILARILNENGIECTDIQIEQLIRFYEMMVEKNKVMNLTAITEFEDVAVKHFADSLVIGKIKGLSSEKVIDIGTGAGFPGIPLKILYPDIQITLLDSLNKRIVFLNEIIEALDLKGINTIHARAEEAASKNDLREQFDVAVSRAVANLSTLVEYCLPFVSIGGSFISYKGDKALIELNDAKKAINILGGEYAKSIDFTLSGSEFSRSLIQIRKVKSTPKKYPRSGNKPSSDPIK